MHYITHTYASTNLYNYACVLYMRKSLTLKEEISLAHAVHNRKGRELYTAVSDMYLTSVPT